jgi:tetratricopeptide (TPR) repeat protein
MLEVLAWLDEQEARGLRHVSLRAHRAMALACLGRFDEARAIQAGLRVELEDRGARIGLALMTGHQAVDIELFAGDPAAAAMFGEEGCRMLEELGERTWLSTAVAKLGECYYRLGRLDEAEAEALRAAELGASDDVVTQMDSRQVRAKVLARRGEHERAERLAREAIAIAEGAGIAGSFWPNDLALAEVLELAGRPAEAVQALDVALSKLDRKRIFSVAEEAGRRRDALLLQLEQ